MHCTLGLKKSKVTQKILQDFEAILQHFEAILQDFQAIPQDFQAIFPQDFKTIFLGTKQPITKNPFQVMLP